MKYDVTKGGYILLGRCGENLARTVEIDVSEYLVEYPGAVVTLLHRRHCAKWHHACFGHGSLILFHAREHKRQLLPSLFQIFCCNDG